jgi:hypothetical protein
MGLKNMAWSFVVFYALVILVLGFWNGFEQGYQLEEQNLQDEKNIFQKLSEVNLLKGINDLTTGIQKLGKISNPADLLGALAISASGTLQILGGMVTFPIDLFIAASGFYDGVVPSVISQIIGFFVVLSVGFILLKAKLGVDV